MTITQLKRISSTNLYQLCYELFSIVNGNYILYSRYNNDVSRLETKIAAIKTANNITDL